LVAKNSFILRAFGREGDSQHLIHANQTTYSGASPKLGFRFLVTSLVFATKHTHRQIINKNNITPKMETNHTIIFYALLRDHRFENY
jgi:hypothetical protein